MVTCGRGSLCRSLGIRAKLCGKGCAISDLGADRGATGLWDIGKNSGRRAGVR